MVLQSSSNFDKSRSKFLINYSLIFFRRSLAKAAADFNKRIQIGTYEGLCSLHLGAAFLPRSYESMIKFTSDKKPSLPSNDLADLWTIHEYCFINSYSFLLAKIIMFNRRNHILGHSTRDTSLYHVGHVTQFLGHTMLKAK